MERTQLLALHSGLVENVVRPGSLPHRSAEEFSPEFQVSFPYRGMFVWHVGRDDVVGDANQILFVCNDDVRSAVCTRREAAASADVVERSNSAFHGRAAVAACLEA
jgi:hypothetical protein